MKQKLIILPLVSLFFFINCSSKKDATLNGTDKNKQVESVSNKTNQSSKKTGDDLTFKTSDGLDISGRYSYDESKKETAQPLVIFIHQFNQTKEQWKDSFIDSLIASGYKVLAYDIRGHGKSSKVSYDLSLLLEDVDKAPKDLDAIFVWSKSRKGIDTSRIGIIGTSIGGNLGCYAKAKLGAKTVVSVSNSKDTFLKFLGIDERMMGRVFLRVPSVFILCGDKDGSHAEDSKYLMENYIDTPKDLKVYSSDKHGMYLIDEHPEILQESINWFKKYL